MSDIDNKYEYEILPEECAENDLSFKIIIIGDAAVGKSSLTLNAVHNKFLDCYTPTIGFEFSTLNIRVNDKYIKLQIWDTCGQEAYRSLINSFYRNSSLAMIVYAINDEKSYKNIEVWLNEIRTIVGLEAKVYLIGNKSDLENDRRVKREDAEKFSEEHDFDYFIETSAKNGDNTKNVFIQAAIDLYKKNLDYERSKNTSRNPSGSQIEKNYKIKIENDSDMPRKKKCFC